MSILVYLAALILLSTCFLDLISKAANHSYSLMILRFLFFIPLLSGTYFYFHFHTFPHEAPYLFYMEAIFSLAMIFMAYRTRQIVRPDDDAPLSSLVLATITVGLSVLGIFWLVRTPVSELVAGGIAIPNWGQLHIVSLYGLVVVLIFAWRLESFWRVLTERDRLQYKYLVIAFYLIIGSLGWAFSYRLAYLRLNESHLLLLSVLMLVSWLLMLYAVARHRLLNRRIFVSRKVVYSAIAPTLFAAYFILLGLASLIVKAFEWPLPYVLRWLAAILGLVLIIALMLSTKMRSKVKYFISTNFYVNKYEYRDEWLAFSDLLKGRLEERGVVDALRQILHESLYTEKIMIWLGDRERGFHLAQRHDMPEIEASAPLSPDDPLVGYLEKKPYLYIESLKEGDQEGGDIDSGRAFLTRHGLALVAGLTIGEQIVGLVGLGPEYTGGKYGRDDFDLLAALGSQAASALLAVQTAEKLALAREQSAWETLSAFVLHDIKNAATLLGLVQQNAADNIHDPEFQKDMLSSIDDALKRMDKVQIRLKTLKGEIKPVIREIDLCAILLSCWNKLSGTLNKLEAELDCPNTVSIRTDPEFLYRIMENLLINALEAGGSGTKVVIRVRRGPSQSVVIELDDNGPGIAAEMLPDRLFAPFATSKPKGNGIGLWQVRRLVEGLGGSIKASNKSEGGARFSIELAI